MPPRLSKRQQRELEELQQLESAKPADQSQDEAEEQGEDEQPQEVAQLASKFGLLQAASEDEEDSEDAAEQLKSKKSTKKKKKKKKSSQANPSATPSTSAPAKPAGKTTTGKPQKNKSGKDEIDLALEELASKLPHLQSSGKGAKSSTLGAASPTAQALFSLLGASLKDFDSEAEMRRFFGSKRTQQWPPGPPHSISFVPLDDYERRRKGYVRNGEKWWNVEHPTDYKRTQLKFLHCVTMSEPSHLFALYRSEPWHIDTLLQIGEILKHQEELSQAADFVERAIYVFEHALPSAFDLGAGSSRLDFDRIENRPFFLALHRQVLSLSRRGTPRTAFEFARLLFALDPVGDPHGATSYLDFLAAKGGTGQWLLDVWDLWPQARKEIASSPDVSHGIDVRCLPGWAYTRALILYDSEIKKHDSTHEASTAALTDAILSFPEVVPYLVDKAGINLPSRDPAGSALHMLSHLYALRANSLWKNEPHSDWLVSTVTSAEPRLGSSTTARDAAYKHFANGPTEAMVRHANVADLRAISAYPKPDFTHAVTHAYDPIAPSTSLSSYDDTYFQDLPRASVGGPSRQMPGGFDGEDDEGIDLPDNVDPQVLLNHLMDQAEAEGQGRVDPGLLQRLFARFVGAGEAQEEEREEEQ
ncbi:Transcriptional repressor TCF25 [Ceratobasidium sp. AG-Ba]|nr:Transcriptional repressor TCF25 [Ceratobasidium sp. AG-Ba]